jgi:hypothetical protein
VLLKFYADESYNGRTFNFGGWLAEESAWTRIENQWSKRIEYERRKRGKFDRYHASDCASTLGDYQGWTIPEQIQHVKKLQGIITRRSDIGAVCFGLDFAALTRIFATEKDHLAAAYNLAVRKLMIVIYRVIRLDQGHRVAIIFDHTPKHDGVIVNAFNSLMDDKTTTYRYSELFTTIAPMRWQDCVALQPADMIAFDTFKLLDCNIHRPSVARLRKSLEALMGNGVQIFPRFWGERELTHLYEEMQRRSLSGAPSV